MNQKMLEQLSEAPKEIHNLLKFSARKTDPSLCHRDLQHNNLNSGCIPGSVNQKSTGEILG